jgi:hypothetical protein
LDGCNSLMKLVWALTSSLPLELLYLSTGHWWRSVMPLIPPWRRRSTGAL